MIPRPAPRRAMILFAVLMVVTIAALVGAAGMYTAQVRITSAGASLKAAQARALAWSGVQAVMAELADQRDAIISGHEPLVTGEWELYKGSNRRGVVRLLPVGAGGAKVQSEAAKLDVNTATPEMLAKVPGLNEELAKAIVGARDARRFQSLAELATIEGITPGLLSEPLPADGKDTAEGAGATSIVLSLTAYSFEPCIQLGAGPDGSAHRGQRRLDITSGTSDEMAAGLDSRFGDDLAAKLGAMLKGGKDLKSRSDTVKSMRSAGVAREYWARVLDLLEAGPDPFAPGRVDVNRASSGVLACIPGFDAARARRATELRTGIASERLASPVWLVEEGVLTPDQFEQAANFVGVRSFQWRVVVEAGESSGGDSDTSRTLAEAPLASRAVLEAVIDISSQRPRVAFLRDVTLRDAAREMARRPAVLAEEEPEPPEPATPAVSPPAPAATPGPPAPPPPPKPDASKPAPPISVEAKDRRLGRWTAGAPSGVQQ